ncbi:TIGR02677 family protein [Streptomyces sp. NPDC059875]|uniref:TIGR02677 family protein n=1 Tax=unclassified Streptomyces TaxID=2593676 RepID=UPI003658C17B
MTSPHRFADRMPIVTYLTAKHALYYRMALDVLLEEEARLGIHLPTADISQEVSQRLATAPELQEEMPAMEDLLESLHGWGNVARIYNMRRSGTAQEFLHKDFLYQLTSEGAQVHRTMTLIDQEMGTTGALQASMLPEVLEAMEILVASAEQTPPDLVGAGRAFQRLVGGFTQLSENAKRFVQGLNRSLAVDGKLDIEAFLAYKEVVVSYLQTFILTLDRHGPRISALIARAEEVCFPQLLEEIASVEAAPQLGISKEAIVARDTTRLRGQWAGVRSWFLTGTDRPPVAQTLQDRASDAVNHILLTIRQINDQRFRRVDRTADLVALASWFDRMDDTRPDDIAALWRTAFGMYSARHLGTVRPLEDDIDILPDDSWWHGPPAPVSAALRATGPRSRSGPLPRVRSSRRAKSLLAVELGKEQEKATSAEDSLAARSPIRFSMLGQLNDAEAEVLLRCLDSVLSTRPDPAGIRRSKTSDGRLLLVLAPVEGATGGTASLALRGGRMSLADMELTLHRTGKKHA